MSRELKCTASTEKIVRVPTIELVDLVIHSSIKYLLGAHSLLRMQIKIFYNIVTSFRELMCFDVLYIPTMTHLNCKVLQSLN